MQTVATANNLRIAILMEMLEEVSRAQDPQAAVMAFSSRIWRIRPIDHFVGVSTRSLSPGEYKITRRYRHIGTADERRDPGNPWRDWDRLPTYTGGFIGETIAEGEPRLIHDLFLTGDPALGDSLGDMGSCIATPTYDGGRIHNWSFYFRRGATAYSLDDLEQNLLSGNLFGAMTSNLVSLQKIKSLNDSLRRQFEEVARVQHALLPERNPPIPGLSIATSYLTSEQAGGDYYDFFELPGGRWGILIADVAGHGPGAATIMAMLHAILHAYPDLSGGPAVALRFANERLMAARMDTTFVTAIFAIYDPATRELTYSRAGHPLPRVKDTRTGEVRNLDGEAAVPLGITTDLEVPEHTVRLRPGETVVLFTDGITESFNKAREMFGTDGLDEALRKCSGEPDCVVDSVHTALYKHTGARTRDDDQTIVVFKVLDGGSGA